MTAAITQRIAFGGGCHWCTEAVFQALRGVTRVEQGWAASNPPDEAESEAALVHFDAQVIPLDVLVAVHLHTHSATANHALRGRYRSAVYAVGDAQAGAAGTALQKLADDFDAPLVTRVLPLAGFSRSPERYQNYYAKRPDMPFCQTHIDPKLARIRAEFSGFAERARAAVTPTASLRVPQARCNLVAPAR